MNPNSVPCWLDATIHRKITAFGYKEHAVHMIIHEINQKWISNDVQLAIQGMVNKCQNNMYHALINVYWFPLNKHDLLKTMLTFELVGADSKG